MGVSVNSVVYNLAFSPSLEYLDMSGCVSSNHAGYVENLGKLISISLSLVNLIIEDYPVLFNSLTLEFFKALGENKTIKTFSLNNSGNGSGGSTQAE